MSNDSRLVSEADSYLNETDSYPNESDLYPNAELPVENFKIMVIK